MGAELPNVLLRHPKWVRLNFRPRVRPWRKFPPGPSSLPQPPRGARILRRRPDTPGRKATRPATHCPPLKFHGQARSCRACCGSRGSGTRLRLGLKHLLGSVMPVETRLKLAGPILLSCRSGGPLSEGGSTWLSRGCPQTTLPPTSGSPKTPSTPGSPRRPCPPTRSVASGSFQAGEIEDWVRRGGAAVPSHDEDTE